MSYPVILRCLSATEIYTATWIFVLGVHCFTGNRINIGSFLFKTNGHKISKGEIRCLSYQSPVRQSVNNTYRTGKVETGQDWQTFMTRRNIDRSTMVHKHKPKRSNDSETAPLLGKSKDGKVSQCWKVLRRKFCCCCCHRIETDTEEHFQKVSLS